MTTDEATALIQAMGWRVAEGKSYFASVALAKSPQPWEMRHPHWMPGCWQVGINSRIHPGVFLPVFVFDTEEEAKVCLTTIKIAKSTS